MNANVPSKPSSDAYRHASPELEARVEELLGRMTLEEKVDQLHQCGIDDANPNNVRTTTDEFRPTYGSFILNARTDVASRDAVQRRCIEKSRLGIPAIFGADVIHGYRTIFPIPLAMAGAWDGELVRRACRVAAEEAWAGGVDWTFAPMLDIALDPRWGRIAETFGESPHAAAAFGGASVRGFQGDRFGEPGVIASCLKHYVGYGASEGGRDYSHTDVSPQRLWETYLPPFAAGVAAGARTVMSAFNDLNGIPTTANCHTLTEILRERWGFSGFVVSDWNAVLQLIEQGFAADEAEAVRLAIAAGVEMDMTDGLYRKHLPSLVERGLVAREVVDEAVRRVLRVKFELGLFERPYRGLAGVHGAGPDVQSLALAEEVASRSIVLLKNRDAVLPLAPGLRRVALIGPLADDRDALLGSWKQQGRPEEVTSLLAGLREKLPATATLRHARGCDIEEDDREGIAEAVALAEDSDVVLLCLGEAASMSGENASRSSLRLPGVQEELVHAIAATGRPIVLLLVSGRPIELHAIEPKLHAIVALWQPGTRGGAAAADILLGRRAPSGRLAVTWPRTTGQIPLYHYMRPRARSGREGAYQDIDTSAHYEFGHGLGYTAFVYEAMRLERSEVRAGETLTAEITVRNKGAHDGIETVLWFIRDPAASITRPMRELKHFESAMIPAGGSKTFQFNISPERDLTFPNADGRPVLEPGEIILFAGAQSARFHVVTETQSP